MWDLSFKIRCSAVGRYGRGEVSFGPINLGLPEEEVRRRVEMALNRLGLAEYGSRGPQYLSGGEKRRVAIG